MMERIQSESRYGKHNNVRINGKPDDLGDIEHEFKRTFPANVALLKINMTHDKKPYLFFATEGESLPVAVINWLGDKNLLKGAIKR